MSLERIRVQPASLALAAMAGLLTSCGAGGDANPNGNADAGTGNDCTLYLVPPAQANVGQEVEVGVVLESGAGGVQSYTWSITRQGVQQPLIELSNPVDRVSFVPVEPGPYQVLVDATIGGFSCQPAIGDINVIATGALSVGYRMRIQPAAGAPMQDVSVRIFGGADAVLPSTALELGETATGTIVDAAGNGVPAYVRARRRDASVQTDYETFSSAAGVFDLRLPLARFDLTIVPQESSLPSRYLPNLSLADLNSTIALPTPVALSGHVFDASGAPLQGARVSLVVDGARSTEAVSAVDGAFSVLASAGQLTGLAVAAPAGSGMPALRADSLAAQPVGEASDVVIRYQHPVVSAQVDVSLPGGDAAASARGEWRAELASAGTVELAQVETVAGSLRVAATANAAGQLQSPLSAVSADLFVASADAAHALVERDLPWATTPSRALALANLVNAAITVDASGSPVPAQILATPLDVLAPQLAPASSTADAAGQASLQLVRGGNYLLSATDSRQGSISLPLVEVQPGLATTEIALPGTLIAKGQLNLSGGVAAGAQVSLYCTDCTGPLASVARASAVADGAGRYVLRVPDPGVTDL